MIGAAILLASVIASVPGEQALPDCDNAFTQQDMNWCAHQDFLAADAELNRVWAKVAGAMQDDDQSMEQSGYDDGRPGYYPALLDAERAWLDYRDKHCVSEGYLARGGTLEPLLVSTCKTHLTKLRTEELRGLVEFPE